MGCLQEYLCDDTRRFIRIEEETIDTVTLPESANLPPQSFLTLGKRLEFDDERSLVGTRTCNKVITLNLLTALNSRVGSQNRINLIDNLTCAGH